MEDRIYYLIKFSEEKYINDLYENGTIFLNTFEYFQTQENNDFRGDPEEATIQIKNFPNPENYVIELTDTRTGDSIRKVPGEIFLSYKNLNPGNLYCMTCIKHSDFKNGKFEIDSKLEEFGNHALLINDPKEFKKRLEKEIHRLNLTYQARAVRYYDKWKHNGPLTLFHKTVDYSYQNEYRIVVPNNSNKPIKINIGSLSGISQIVTTEKLKRLKFQIRVE
ncbi:hypothetical protein [Salegentibacter mishustinae]|nr:hypothetical protein [Salegentibacter mishustinae]PNW21137.1 hypothetical protein APB85_07675 [Salegentibacter mishustinae]PZX59471.1 hypothetical protein LY54_03408 [Salegentibacter mishustinae]GGX01483.1 hypothetical protein GCM10008086_32860 [Salegentibacter mishustinae]